MAKRWQGVAGAAACVVLLLIAYAALASENDLGDNETQIGFAFVFHGLVWLLCSVLAATAIAQEKESDTWTLLLATPLSGARIVRGKVLGLCRRMMWPMILIVAHFALFTVTGVIPVASLLLILWVIVTFNSLWLATGIFLSLRLRKVTFAVILNLMLAVVAYGAVPLSLFVAGQVLGSHRTGERLATQSAWYVPFSYLAIGIDGLHRDEQGYPYYYNTPGATSDPRARFWVPDARLGALPPGSFANNIHVTKNTYLTIVFCVGCAYLALAALLLWATARHFDRIVGRTPQRRLHDDEIARSRLLAQPSVVS
jgi:ABC-type transport system involved in multi-copper enzyme maturation permease subunit